MCFKAHLVVQGFSQWEGINYSEKFPQLSNLPHCESFLQYVPNMDGPSGKWISSLHISMAFYIRTYTCVNPRAMRKRGVRIRSQSYGRDFMGSNKQDVNGTLHCMISWSTSASVEPMLTTPCLYSNEDHQLSSYLSTLMTNFLLE